MGDWNTLEKGSENCKTGLGKMAIRKLETGDWSSRKLGIGTVENGGLEVNI